MLKIRKHIYWYFKLYFCMKKLIIKLFESRFGVCGVAIVAVATQFAAGFFIHFFIPTYRYMFYIQMRSLFVGWKDLYKIKMLFSR